jgi:hypothetical protein
MYHVDRIRMFKDLKNFYENIKKYKNFYNHFQKFLKGLEKLQISSIRI